MFKARDSIDPEALGQRIREMAGSLGTQAAVAERLGVSERQLRQYMQGKHAPPFTTVALLAKLSGFDLNWAASGIGSPHGPSPLPLNAAVMNEVTARVAKLYDNPKLAAAVQRSQAMISAHEKMLPAIRAQEIVAAQMVIAEEYSGVMAQLDDPNASGEDVEVQKALKGLDTRLEQRRARGETPPFGQPALPPAKAGGASPRGKRSP